jgi:HTH-type transcriptional regulator, transcriptional repressor of NAD biosynthesis genes
MNTTRPERVGLTLGKYAPLHRGHQAVIETALAEMDRVVVLIYDVPEVTPVPLPVRAGWIRQLYPQVEVLEAWDGPLEVSDRPEVTALHDAYLQQRLAGRGITHFYSSEFYGAHVSRGLGAVDRRVDGQRTAVPVAATQIRQAPFAHRQFLEPLVYRDLITHVVFLGAPSTGKTTLAETLARDFGTQWVPEYGRAYWEQHQVDRRLTLEQLVEIAEGHCASEHRLLAAADRYLFVDTDATTTRQFALYYHDRSHPRLEELADATLRRYDLFFLCMPDIPYDDTWDRSGEVVRSEFHRRVEADLIARRIPYIPLLGDLRARVATVRSTLSVFRKYAPRTAAQS